MYILNGYVMGLVSSNSDLFSLIILFVIFCVIVAAAYYATYIIARFQKGTVKQGNFQVIEVISVGQGKYLELVRAGTKYLVISVSKKDINLLATLDAEEVVIPNEQGERKIMPFGVILDKLKNNNEGNNGEDQNETKEH